MQVLCLLNKSVCIGCVYKPLIHTTEAKQMFLKMATKEEYDVVG